ncbi:MAG: hypothetical protein IJF14_03815 [Clostridia bacterium]|nr:hypothetical protein [Clostridia bacterium]
MNYLNILQSSLKIFDANAAAEGAQGTSFPTPTVQEAAGKKTAPVVSKRTDVYDAKHEEFRRLIDGEYKEAYTREFQTHFNRRHREAMENAEKLQAQKPIIDALCARYGIKDGDTKAILAALQRDKTAVDARRRQREERASQNKIAKRGHREEKVMARLKDWQGESFKIKENYPDFDIGEVATDKRIMAMVKAGLSLEEAYEATHLSSIKETIARTAAEKAVARTVEGIRSRGMRHRENGISSQNAVTLKTDISKLTREERLLLALRAANGEEISF